MNYAQDLSLPERRFASHFPAKATRIAMALCAAIQYAAAADAGVHFEDVTDRAELRAPLAGLMGHGGAWGDSDGDGQIDLFAGGFADRPDAEYAPAAGPVLNRLFRNEGNGRFAAVDMPGI